MGCRPIVLGPRLVRILRAPSLALPAELRRPRLRDGKGRFVGDGTRRSAIAGDPSRPEL